MAPVGLGKIPGLAGALFLTISDAISGGRIFVAGGRKIRVGVAAKSGWG